MPYGTRYIPMSFYDSLADARKTLRENSLRALETQIELLDFLARPSSHGALFNLMRVYYGSDANPDMPTERVVERAAWLHDMLSSTLGAAPTYYVSPDMCEMVKHAAEDMRRFSDEGLSPKDIPTPTGFLLFAKPIQLEVRVVLRDGDSERWVNEKHAFAGVAWANDIVGLTNEGIYERDMVKTAKVVDHAPGIAYYLFEHPHDMAASMNLAYGDGDDMLTEQAVKDAYGPIAMYDWSGWAYGMPWTKTSEAISEFTMVEGHSLIADSVDAMRRMLLATWKLLGERITTVESNRPPRHIRRRAERVAPETGDVLIVRLRKEVVDRRGDAPLVPLLEGQEAGSDEPWYTHRFLVAGHWKHQHYGPRNSLKKLIWVAPYVKGPEGAPLVARDRVYSLEA